jgi:membrane-bound lytic murein transglycosylase A
VPVYGVPADLVRARPGDARRCPTDASRWAAMTAPAISPYYDRGQIEDGALPGRA